MKVRIQIPDEDITLNVTPEFLRQYLVSIEGDPYLDYKDGGEPTPLVGDYENILKAVERAEAN
jgi:hypothetical protein